MKSKNSPDGNRCRLQRSIAAMLLATPVMLLVAFAPGCDEAATHDGDPAGHGGHGTAAAAAETKPKDMGLGEHPPFEFMGVYTLPAGKADLVIQPGPDASMDIALVPVSATTPEGLDAVVKEAGRIAIGPSVPTSPGTTISPGGKFYQLQVGGDVEMRFPVDVPAAGKYALFTQHFADEFQTLFQAGSNQPALEAQRIFKERFGQILIPPQAMKIFAIAVEPAASHVLTPSFTVPARVGYNTEQMAHVGSAVAGRVAELKVRQGADVKKGDVLIVVDSPDLGEAQSDFLQKQTAVATATPAVELAQSAYDRAKQLYDKNQGTSLNEVEKRQADLQAAKGALQSAKAAVVAAENKLHLLGMDHEGVNTLEKTAEINPKYTIRAPIAGQVTARDVTLGELVRPDKDSLLVLANLSTVWVLAEVPEARLKDVVNGSAVTVTVAAFPDEKFDGVVSFISAELDPATRTVRVRIEVKNDARRLKPGMFAQAEIKGVASPATRAVLAVPDAAVQLVDGRPAVFVPMEDKPNTFLKRPVTLEPAVGGMLPVRYGLKEGEPIVIQATFILKAELGKSGAKHEH
jgi:membrane fusion protein, heavy metal efflux system